jgi:hypothetical protein
METRREVNLEIFKPGAAKRGAGDHALVDMDANYSKGIGLVTNLIQRVRRLEESHKQGNHEAWPDFLDGIGPQPKSSRKSMAWIASILAEDEK